MVRKIIVKENEIDFYNLGFDLIETKWMFVSNYKNGKWDDGKLVPFGPVEMSPAAGVLNYGQGIFEGLKALMAKDGRILLFRPIENAKRLNRSADRVLIPRYDESKFIKAIKQVVSANKECIPPYDSNGALYIRPLVIGSGPILGIGPAPEYKLIIYVSPVGPYFPDGFKGIDIQISKKYTRASPGGTGFSKTCSNYASTMMPTKEAKSQGYAQILYLDAVSKEYINEVGAANFCAVIENTLVTPKFDGTILEGITIQSILQLAKEKLNIKIQQRDISYKELFKDSCTECFCTGTAAVITPVGSVSTEKKVRIFNDKKPGEITTKLYKLLTGIQRLDLPDEFNWIEIVE